MGELVYKVSVTARPVDGAANQALIDVMADYLGLKRRHLTLIRWFQSRHKVIQVDEGS